MTDDFWTKSRVVSGVWAAALILIAGFFGDARSFFGTIAWLTWPIACIWLGESMNYVRDSTFFGRRIAPPAAGPIPGAVYSTLGWVMLAGLSLYIGIMRLS